MTLFDRVCEFQMSAGHIFSERCTSGVGGERRYRTYNLLTATSAANPL